MSVQSRVVVARVVGLLLDLTKRLTPGFYLHFQYVLQNEWLADFDAVSNLIEAPTLCDDVLSVVVTFLPGTVRTE